MKLVRRLLVGFTAIYGTAAASVSATLFYADQFNYPNGELTSNDGTGDNVSGGNWISHDGGAFNDNIDVVDGAAELLASGSEDAHRVVPGGVTMEAGDKWYFAALVTVNDRRANPASEAINNDYFLHFKDNAFGFRTRVWVDDPSTGVGGAGFTFGLAATSGSQTQMWGTDLSFGAQYTVVGSYDFDTGASELWVNPVDESSPKLVESTTVGPGTFINALALRQDFVNNVANNQVLVDAVAVADTFGEALLALPEPTGVALGLTSLVAAASIRRRRAA